MDGSVVLVGCGNMGHAMLAGWLASGRLPPGRVMVVEPSHDNALRARKLGVEVVAEASELPGDLEATLVVIAIKPQAVRDILPAYRGLAEGGTTFLSVLAGTPIATIQSMLGGETPVIRCMPNTPAAIGRGMMVTMASPQVIAATEEFVAALLSASGEVARIEDEALMDAVTAVSGSGPAYFFHFVECLAEAGEKAGLPAEIAMQLARQTAFGAASLVVETGEHPAELRRQVTSPNGTTQAALDVLMGEARMADLMAEAVEAARKRSVELGG